MKTALALCSLSACFCLTKFSPQIFFTRRSSRYELPNFSLPRHTFQCGDDVAGIFIGMKIKPLPSLEYLKECFELDATCPSGLRWRKRPRCHFGNASAYGRCNKEFTGKVAGFLKTDVRRGKSYYEVMLHNVAYYAHRIVYSLYHSKDLSVNIQIDHRDGNGLNNKPKNLREATHDQNRHNTVKVKTNTSGYKGVSWHKANKYWRFVVTVNKKTYSLAAPTAEKAYELGCELREKLHEKFTNHG